MAYEFDTQASGTSKTTIAGSGQTHQINGINAREQDANIIMAGLSSMYFLVDWRISEVERTVKQDVIDSE